LNYARILANKTGYFLHF